MGLRWVGFGGALLLAWGCETTIVVVEPCGAPAAELEAVERAAKHLRAYSGRRRLDVTRACAGIVEGLEGDRVAIERPLDQTTAKSICDRAKAAIEARLDAGADLSAGIVTFGGCDDYLAATEACLFGCGTSTTCEAACEAAGLFQGGCAPPTLVFESSDGELRTTVQAHFAPILALDLFVANHGGEGVDRLEEAFAAARASTDGESCGVERRGLDRQSAEARVAYDELIDLLSWVRISRLSVIE